MMTQDTLNTMKDILKIQQKMIIGLTEPEKTKIVNEISRALERIDRQMSMMQQMMGGQMALPLQKPAKPEKKPQAK